MICQLCLESVATHHLTERSPSGRFALAHYCHRCYQAKLVEPPATSGSFPRPRFTIKNIMIISGVWTVPNAIAAWVFRSGYVTGTPAQIRQSTIDTFLAVNLLLGFFVVWIYLLTWLGRVMWYKKTRGLVPMPQQKITVRQLSHLLAGLVPLLGWCVAVTFVERWLTPQIWPMQRTSIPLYALLMWAPLIPLMFVRFSRNRFLRERIWQEWRAASRQERLLRILALAWSMGVILLVVFAGPTLLTLGFQRWFPMPPVLLVGVGGQVALLAAVAFSTSRR
jgi:hypothetical protein